MTKHNYLLRLGVLIFLCTFVLSSCDLLPFGGADEIPLVPSQTHDDTSHRAGYYRSSCVYALMGDEAPACKWLKEAIARDKSSRESAREDPDFDCIRESACFQALMGPASDER